MNTFKLASLAAVLGSLILVSSAFAQTDSPAPGLEDTTNDGLLGHPYASIDAKLLQFRKTNFPSPIGIGANTTVNISTLDFLDLGLRYDGVRAKNSHWKMNDQVVSTYATGFCKLKGFAPYVTAGIGYGWQNTELIQIKHNVYDTTTASSDRYQRAVFDVGTGVEIYVYDQTSVRLGVDHQENLRTPRPNDWVYQTALNYNFNDVVGMGMGMDYQEGNKGGFNALVYHMGVHFLFD